MTIYTQPLWRQKLLSSHELEIKKYLEAVYAVQGVIETGLFGSYAKSTCTPSSDVDVYIVYDPSTISRRDLRSLVNYLDFTLDTTLDFQAYYIEESFGPISLKVTEGRLRYDKEFFRLC